MENPTERRLDLFVEARGEMYRRQLEAERVEAERATHEEKKVNNQKVKELVK